MSQEYLLLRHRNIPNLDQLETYLQNGGFSAFRKALTVMQPQAVLNEVELPPQHHLAALCGCQCG